MWRILCIMISTDVHLCSHVKLIPNYPTAERHLRILYGVRSICCMFYILCSHISIDTLKMVINFPTLTLGALVCRNSKSDLSGDLQ